MRTIDPGHKYGLARLDGDGEEELVFVKREGEKYPGNVGHHQGTNIQEVIRACIARIVYLNDQIPDVCNNDATEGLRDALWALELRAARRHGRTLSVDLYANLEKQPTCPHCGHIGCEWKPCPKRRGSHD